MRKEKVVTREVLMCDACEVTLEENTKTYITMEHIDLCNSCASRVLQGIPIPAEKLAPMVDKLREELQREENGFGLSKKEIEKAVEEVSERNKKTIFTNPAETPKRYVDIDKGPPYPEVTYDTTGIDQTLKTTGIDQMIPVTSATLTVPEIRTSDIKNLGDL